MSRPSTSSWQQAWDQAQPHLQTIRGTLSDFPRAAPRVLRVGQLDAELLDQELLQILTDPLSKALGFIQSSYRSRFEPELTFLVHLILYKYSVWDLGATYGAKLQNLRYKIVSGIEAKSLAPSGLPRRILWLHAAITILVPYLHSRLRVYALSRSWPDAPSSDSRRKAWESLTRIESAHNALSLASFIAFLCDGRYRTWADRLLGLRLVPSQRLSTRNVSYEFMNRQMVWHAFTEFLLFLLPLINTRILRRRITSTVSQLSPSKFLPSAARSALGMREDISTEKALARHGKYWSLPEDQCAICAEDATFSITDPHHDIYTAASALITQSSVMPTDEPSRYPIYTPYMTSCGHVYCYVCLSERMLRSADDGESAWECLRCEEMVHGADRVEHGAIEETLSQSDGFQMDEASFESEDFVSTTSE